MKLRRISLDHPKDVHQFVMFPFALYRRNPYWVPPLISGVKASLNPQKHPFFKHSEGAFFLVEEGKHVLGRIAALDNKNYNTYYQTREAAFAFFESVEDVAVSRLLFTAAMKWAKLRGLTHMSGPKGLIGADGSGILVEGFDHRPALTVPYNYPYYDTLIKDSGFEKARDNLSGYINGKEWGEIPKRFSAIAEQVKKRRGLWITSFHTKAELRRMVPEIQKVYRAAFEGGYGFFPATDEEMAWIADELISIADPRLIKLVMKSDPVHGDQVVGFLFAYPDISAALQRAKGRLFPFGWLDIMTEPNRTKWVNVNGVGILPEYQGTGANAVLYTEMAKTIQDFGFEHADTVLIGEENYNSFSDNTHLGVSWYKRHRLYKRDIP